MTHEFSHSQNSGRPDVSILVVGYNSAEIIGKCLSSIPLGCTRYSYEVRFVDQGDGSTESLVSHAFPNITIVPSQGNLGFAGGNNLLARDANGHMLLLLNPDVELRPNSIDLLLDGTKRYPKASAWGGVTLDSNGLPDIGNTVHVPSLREMASRLFGRSSVRLREPGALGDDQEVAVLSGGFVLIDRAAWLEAQGLDERYFLYCEEVDFFYRLGNAGHSFWRIGASRAYHDIGHGEVASPTRSLFVAAGTMQFARIHWSHARRQAAFLLIWLAALQRYGVGLLFGLLSSRGQQLIDANKAVALSPSHWRFGYDENKGLLTKL